MYLPMIGILLAFGITLARCCFSFFFGWMAIAIVAVLAFVAYHQTRYWENTFTLLQHSINVTKNNYLAYLNLGVEYDLQGKEKLALENYQKALLANPKCAEANYNIGNIEFRHRRREKAKQEYRTALLYDPTLFDAHYDFAYRK